MGFWSGIEKIIEGVEESVEGIGQLFVEAQYHYKRYKREKFSGRYKLNIDLFEPQRSLIAIITYNGSSNLQDIDLITAVGGTTDLWDDLSDRDKSTVIAQVRSFRDLILEGRAEKLK